MHDIRFIFITDKDHLVFKAVTKEETKGKRYRIVRAGPARVKDHFWGPGTKTWYRIPPSEVGQDVRYFHKVRRPIIKRRAAHG